MTTQTESGAPLDATAASRAGKARKQPTKADRVLSRVGLGLTILAYFTLWLVLLLAALTTGDDSAGYWMLAYFAVIPIGGIIALAGLVVSTIQMARLSGNYDRIAAALALLPLVVGVIWIAIVG